MASFGRLGLVFGKDTPVLRLTGGKDPHAKWVLWPVLAWRVVAPVPRERPLNMFQLAVLGLARAGVVRAGDMAERLLIATDLASLVVLELQGMALLDHAGRPTARGVAVLQAMETEPVEEARVGHVFSDPFTGKLWPRFLSGDLPIADVEPDENGWPVLLSGSAGDPWRDRAFSVLPTATEGVVVVRPSAHDVLRAARRHRRQRDIDDVNDAHDVPRLGRVSFVDGQARPYLLALRVRRDALGDWVVDDPFGHGESVDLRARVEERLDHHQALRSWLAPLVGADPSAATLQELGVEASWKVEERLSLAIRTHDAVYERLVAMQRALLEAATEDAPLDKWDDVLVKAQRVMERVLRNLHEPFVDVRPFLFEELDRDTRVSGPRLDEVVRALGFKTPLPARLSSVRRDDVRKAEQFRCGSLRPRLILALLAARWTESHPMRRAARAHPDLLERLDALATARNRAAHDGAETWPHMVARHVDTTFVAVETLLLNR